MTLILGDYKIVQTSLHVRVGDPAYQTRAMYSGMSQTWINYIHELLVLSPETAAWESE